MPEWEDSPEFQSQDYPVYEGSLNCCSHCGREFQWGDLILVSRDNQLVFCFHDIFAEDAPEVHCQMNWVMNTGQALQSRPMKFGGD